MKMANNYNAALYCRLSREDNSGNAESVSIENQKYMLTEYANTKGYEIVDIYVDDGRSGTNFDRPAFQRMIEDIEKGKINMVITKDLSRLGREHVKTGELLDYYFPKNGIRYIAIDDRYDTCEDDNGFAAIKNVFNEFHARETSKKVRSSRKVAAKEGKFMGSQTPYGYKKSLENKHRLVIDENVSEVVKHIFRLFADGDSARHIGTILNNEGVLPPNEYYYKSLGRDNPYKSKTPTWGSATIMNMLSNQVYIGNIVQGKQHVTSYKIKDRIQVPKSDWIISECMHEALIDFETWNTVQERISSNKPVRVSSKEEVSLFSGLLKCVDCGGLMAFNVKTSGNKKYDVYRCGTYANNGKSACSTHNIHQSTLEQVVLNDIRYYSKLAIKDEQTLIERLMKANSGNQQRSIELYRKQIAKAKRRIIEIDNLVKKLFEEKTNGSVPDNFFKRMLFGYDKEQSTLTEEIEKLEKELAACESNSNDMNLWVAKIKKCINIENLDRGILLELIDTITISEVYIFDGEKHQDITITYKFVGCLDDNNKLFVA